MLMTKITGIVVSFLSLVAALFGAFALADTNEMARMLSLRINEFNSAKWQLHWQVSSIVLLASGCIGFFVGIGIMKNRQWAFFIFAWLLTLLVLCQAFMMMGGHAIFQFEKINPIETTAILLLCIYSWFLYVRKKKSKNA